MNVVESSAASAPEFLRTLLASGALLAIFAAAPAFAAPGDADASFGAAGVARTKLGPGENEARAIVVQPDGKFVTGGYAAVGNVYRFALTRFNGNGSIDAGFGQGGSTLLGTSAFSFGTALALQGDGKLVLAGSTLTDPNTDGFAVARVNANGTPDASFGTAGFVKTPVNGESTASAVAVQADGRIIAAGQANEGFALARYTASGALDATFGNGGLLTSAIGRVSGVLAIALQPDGKIVAAGVSDNHVAVARYTSAGLLDTTFGTGGYVIVDFGTSEQASAVALQADGKIVIAGKRTTGASQFLAARLTAQGALDTAFGTGGKVAISAGTDSSANALAVQPDGRLLLGGTALPSGATYTAAAFVRLNSDGTADATFGTGGIAVRPLAAHENRIAALRLLSDGRIVAAGEIRDAAATAPASAADELVVLLSSTGALDTSFNGTGFLSHDLGSAPAVATQALVQPDGKILAVGSVESTGVLVRYLPNGTLDAAFGTGGVAMGENNGQPAAIALQPDGKIVTASSKPGNGTYDFEVTRRLANGALDTAFGSGGSVTIPIGIGQNYASAVGIQADGRIVVGGNADSSGTPRAALARLMPNGSIDTSFGGTGYVVASFGNSPSDINALTFDAAGHIYTAGSSGAYGTQTLAVLKLNPNGSFDTTFNDNGRVSIQVNAIGYDDSAEAIALQPDGMIVIAGHASNSTTDESILARITTGGGLDPAFGNGGIVRSGAGSNDRYFGVTILPDGRILVAGDASGYSSTEQFNANGTPDTSFGSGGSIVPDLGPGGNVVYSVVRQPDAKLVEAADASGEFAVARYAGSVSAAPAFSVVSRKTHGAAGTFDLPIDTSAAIGGAVTVEPRVIGAGHAIVFQFATPITAPGTATVVDALGNPVGSAQVSFSGAEVTVLITSLPNNQRVTVSLNGVNGGQNATASIGFLAGDVNGSRSVSASDILGVKAHSGQTASSANFLFDLDLSGIVNGADISTVRGHSGEQLN